MQKFHRLSDFIEWCEKLPDEVKTILVARSALRSIPFLEDVFLQNPQNAKRIALQTFQTSAIAYGMATEPGLFSGDAVSSKVNSTVHALYREVNQGVSPYSGFASSTINLAAQAGLMTWSPHVTDGGFVYPAADQWSCVLNDARSIQTENGNVKYFLPPIHPTHVLEYSDGNIEENEFRNLALRKWADLRQRLIDLNEGWEVWIDWYERLINGENLFVDFFVALASLSEETWEKDGNEFNHTLQSVINDAIDFLEDNETDEEKSTSLSVYFVQASDRIVSVRDNQEPFDVLEKSLDQIRDEFARDHNKQEYLSLQRQSAFDAISSIKSQISNGFVNLNEVRDRLRPELVKLAKDCAAAGVITVSLKAIVLNAIHAIDFILGLFF